MKTKPFFHDTDGTTQLEYWAGFLFIERLSGTDKDRIEVGARPADIRSLARRCKVASKIFLEVMAEDAEPEPESKLQPLPRLKS